MRFPEGSKLNAINEAGGAWPSAGRQGDGMLLVAEGGQPASAASDYGGGRGATRAPRAADILERCGRAIAVHHRGPGMILAVAGNGPRCEDARGQLYRTGDAGRTREHVRDIWPSSTQRDTKNDPDRLRQGRQGLGRRRPELVSRAEGGMERSRSRIASSLIRIIARGL